MGGKVVEPEYIFASFISLVILETQVDVAGICNLGVPVGVLEVAGSDDFSGDVVEVGGFLAWPGVGAIGVVGGTLCCLVLVALDADVAFFISSAAIAANKRRD
jgi:hypothetical protein